MKLIAILFFSLTVSFAAAQTNITWTNTIAEDAVHVDFDPGDYLSAQPITNHYQILCDLQNRISADSLKDHLAHLVSFGTRNTFSDTNSSTIGIGAARRWAMSKFNQFSAENDNRLLTSYLSFDRLGMACGDFYDLRNVMAILPGSDTSQKSIIIIEAHMDSRCEDGCDTASICPGAEDNGSGSSLVIELARTMSKYTYKRTIMFMLTIGEEQGLLGADAMADYCANNGVQIKQVQNNDVIGGIICGNTSSAPSCSGLNDIDSTQIRLFSLGTTGAHHRNFTRTIKLWYEETMGGVVTVPTTISIMNQEDRLGRGGDHQPFRQRGYRSCRFTAANEHGDAGVGIGYLDRQHTGGDVIGIDTDADLIVDSFYVDFNYLSRNTMINAMSASLSAIGPDYPLFQLLDEPTGLRVKLLSHHNMPEYRIAVRLPSNLDWDFIYRTTDTSFIVPGLDSAVSYAISVAAINSDGIMGNFSGEIIQNSDVSTAPGTPDVLPYGTPCSLVGIKKDNTLPTSGISLLPARPNPFQETTNIAVFNELSTTKQANIEIRDIQGRLLKKFNLQLVKGNNFVPYHPNQIANGIYFCNLYVEGKLIGSQKIIRALN